MMITDLEWIEKMKDNSYLANDLTIMQFNKAFSYHEVFKLDMNNINNLNRQFKEDNNNNDINEAIAAHVNDILKNKTVFNHTQFPQHLMSVTPNLLSIQQHVSQPN